MRMIDIIAQKKQGEPHSKETIKFLVKGITDGSIPDYQLSAWLMAVCFQGMNFEECAILTEEMAKSGEILDLSSIGEFVIDKHSTGGVGDKITLALIPLLAASGIPVAKLSGRGLGFSGGTIDKLEAIEGFNTSLSLEKFIKQVNSIKVAIGGQTAKLAPADGRLYALRDVTSTVECLPLIASSVVSKKIASGANVIVLDVKFGNGAFVKTKEQAQELSKIMVEIGKRLNRSITAVISSMEEPLGFAVGNAVEVKEAIDILKNQGPSDATELTLVIGAISLLNSKQVSSIDEGKARLQKHIEDGSALKKFEELIIAQGGNAEVVKNPSKLPQPKNIVEIKSEKSGYIKTLSAVNVAKACKLLGAGRDSKEDQIDPAVGIVLNKKVSDKVEIDESLAWVYSNSDELTQLAKAKVINAFEFSDSPVVKPDLIHKIIS